MASCYGKSLLLGIEHLDAATGELSHRDVEPLRRGGSLPAVCAEVTSESLLRLVGAELRDDPDAIDRIC